MLRFLRYTLEFVAAFIGFVILLALLLAWRLSASPITSDFLTPYIETGIEELVPESEAHVKASLLTWNNVDHSVALHADTIRIEDANGGEIADIPALDAKISIFGLLFGQFMPKDLEIDHPQIRLERHADGTFVFGGMAVGANGAQPQPIKDVLRNISEHLSHAALMHKLAVTRAVFDVHDDLTQKDWAVSVPEISVTRNTLSALDHRLEYGALEGRMIFEVSQKDATATLDVHYAYDPKKVQHSLSTTFADLTPAFLAGGHPETLGLGVAAIVDLPLTGKAEVTFDKALDVEAANVEIHGDEGHLAYPAFWDNPCPVKSFDVQAAYDREAQKLTVSGTKIDFQGPTLALDVDGGASSQKGHDMDFTATLRVDNMPMNRYGELWPKPILPDPRYWLAVNLRDGTFTHAEVALKGSLAWNDLGNVAINEGEGKVSAVNGRVTYLDGMPSAANVNAEAMFDLKKMSVQVMSGGVGNVRLMPFTLLITGLADTDQDIDIPLQVGGPVPDILRLLDHQPLGYAKKLGISPDDLQGNIQGLVDFKFPLLKTLEMKDLNIHASANATGVASTKLIPGLDIDQGNLALTLDMSGFNFKGPLAIDKVPFQVVWQENFEQKAGRPLRQATVTGAIRDDQWAGMGIDAFTGTKGPVNVTLQMTRPDKSKTQFSGTLDLTPAAVEVDMLGWKKPANLPAILKFSADAPVGQPVNVTSIDLRGDHVLATGNASLSSDLTQLLSLNLSQLELGRTDAALNFTQTFGPDGALRFDAKGKALDVGGLRGGNDPDRSDPRPKEYHIQVDRLYTGAIGEIDQAQGFASRDGQGWSAIDLRGVVGDGKLLSMQLLPQPDGHRTLAIACDNFGDAMKGLGFTETIKGGKLSVTGQSTIDNPRQIEGKAKISSFTVEKLPVLALLLNATSPFGFSGILTDSADFSRFEGDFRWEGDALTLTRAHAAGSAIGINIDGKIDMNSGDANLQGTLVPFSIVNKMLNYIPLIGGLLTGGENQGVLAVSYQIKGNLDKPDISVNPVSLLTPGFLRNLFFRDGTEDSK